MFKKIIDIFDLDEPRDWDWFTFLSEGFLLFLAFTFWINQQYTYFAITLIPLILLTANTGSFYEFVGVDYTSKLAKSLLIVLNILTIFVFLIFFLSVILSFYLYK